MENKIKEVRDYFKEKILKKEYEILTLDEYTVNIEIEGKYKFCIWISKTKRNIETYSYQYNCFALNFTAKQQDIIWGNIRPIQKSYLKEVLIKEKEAELKQLKKL